MRNRLKCALERPTVPTAGSNGTVGGRTVYQTRSIIKSAVDWCCAGYPDAAPDNGYSPLLALYGPVALSARQAAQVMAELRHESADATDIGVTITKVTNKLPTQAQIGTVTDALLPDTTPQR